LGYTQGSSFLDQLGEYLLLKKVCAACNVIYGMCSLAGAGYRIQETSQNYVVEYDPRNFQMKRAAFRVLFEKWLGFGLLFRGRNVVLYRVLAVV
jgi:hypothetical protein